RAAACAVNRSCVTARSGAARPPRRARRSPSPRARYATPSSVWQGVGSGGLLGIGRARRFARAATGGRGGPAGAGARRGGRGGGEGGGGGGGRGRGGGGGRRWARGRGGARVRGRGGDEAGQASPF